MKSNLSKNHQFSVKKLSALSLGALFLTATVQAAEVDAGALQQQLQREIEKNQIAPSTESLLKPQKVQPLDTSGKEAIDVAGFKVTGLTLITEEEAQAAVKPYINQSLTFGKIKEAAAAIAALYSRMGRVAQAIVPPQDVVDGIIEIKIIEGKAGDVLIDSGDEPNPRVHYPLLERFIRARNPAGEPVDIKGLERSLALINELPGVRAAAELAQGTEEGTVDIKVGIKEADLLVGRVDVSNYGSASTGIPQVMTSLNFNNVLGVGDLATADIVASQGSTYLQTRFAMPIDADGWRMGVAASVLDYETLSSFSSTVSDGEALTVGLNTSYALVREPGKNLSLNMVYENKSYKNRTASVEVSKYEINDLSIGLAGTTFVNNAYISYGVTGLVGELDIQHAQQLINDQNGAKTDGHFIKLTFNASMAKPLPLKKTQLQVSAYGQLSPDNLSSAEQFYLGGPYAVRAYPVAQGGGSSGAVVSAEVSHMLDSGLQISGFVDVGVIKQYANTYDNWQGQTHADNTYTLSSVGVAAKYSVTEKVQLQAALAQRIGDNPLYDQSGNQINLDHKYRDIQAWVKATLLF